MSQPVDPQLSKSSHQKPKASRKRRRKIKVRAATPRQLPIVHESAAGIDLAAAADIWVSVPPERPDKTVRPFAPDTQGLRELLDWLIQSKITTVAMESTGIYWVPLYTLLNQAGLEVVLVNARDVKQLRKKSDIIDCQWLQYLHSVGLLRGSFVPGADIMALRSVSRHRDNVLKAAAVHVQHMQQALDAMNVRLHHVIDDLTGLSGMAIVEAILRGERDPRALAALCHSGIKASAEQVARSLEGQWREDQLFVLQQSHQAWTHAMSQLSQCDIRLWKMAGGITLKLSAEQLAAMQPVPGPDKPKRGRPAKAGRKPGQKPKSRRAPVAPDGQSWQSQLHALFGVDLLAVPGVSVVLGLALLTELGTDWSAFASAGQFASWLGLCPNHHISGGKILRRRSLPVQNRLKMLLRMGAQSLWQEKGIMGAEYRRLKARLGPAAANTAMAHKLARILWHLVKHQRAYDETVLYKLSEQREARSHAKLKRHARHLGYELVPLPLAA